MTEARGLNAWEKLGFAFLLIILVISTLSTSIASQQASKAAKNTDLIAQCTTPGTKCSDLQIISEARRTAQNKCIIDAIVSLPPPSDRVTKRREILDNYDKCVVSETQVIATSTTTTTR